MRLPILAVMVAATAFLMPGERVLSEDTKGEESAEVTLNGIFEAVLSSEVSAGTKKLNSLLISRIVPHGTSVRKGQTIVWFDTEDIDEKIKEAEISLRLARLTLDEDEFNYEQFLASQKLDRAAADRSRLAAKQEYDNYQRVDRDRNIASAEFSLVSSEQSLANAMEELKQLEQMYKEDDLTEESEEIVLKRAQQAVASAEFRLEGTKILTSRTLKQTVPRQTQQAEESLARAELAWQKAVRSLEKARQRQEIEMNRKRDKFRKEQEALETMQAERKMLVLTAPHDGIVYHGELSRGKLSDKASSLEEGATVTGQQVIATIVNPSKLQVRVDLTEALRSKVTVGMRGPLKPAAWSGQDLAARVKSVGSVPFANNKFDCVLSVTGKVDGIAPGTGCVMTLPAAK